MSMTRYRIRLSGEPGSERS